MIDRMSGMLPIIPLIPKGSKEDRAASVCSPVNRGLVLFPNQRHGWAHCWKNWPRFRLDEPRIKSMLLCMPCPTLRVLQSSCRPSP